LPKATSKWHRSELYTSRASVDFASASQQGPSWRSQTSTNIPRHARIPHGSGPTDHSLPDSIPQRRNGRLCGANPNAVHDRVCIRPRSNRMTSSKQQMQNQTICYPGKSDVPTKKSIQLSLPVLHACARSLALRMHAPPPSPTGSGDERNYTFCPRASSTHACVSCPLSLRAAAYASAHVTCRMDGHLLLLAHMALPPSICNCKALVQRMQGILSADSSQTVFTDCSLTPSQRAC
jgi:hypothetical protein